MKSLVKDIHDIKMKLDMTKKETLKLFEERKVRSYYPIHTVSQGEQKIGREVVSPLSAKKFFETQKTEGKIEGGEKREE